MKKSLFVAGMTAAMLLTACGSSNGSEGNTSESATQTWKTDVAAQSIVEAVASNLGEDYWPDTEILAETLSDSYGITSDMYEEFYGQMPMISNNVDTLIVVKVKENMAADVEEAFTTYNENAGEFQYPMNLPKIEAAQIAAYGDYVCYVQLGGYAVDLEDEEEMLKACQEANEQALAIIEQELAE